MRIPVAKRPLLEIAQDWVHSSVPEGSEDHARHAKFLAGHLIAGALTLLALPVYLVWAGPPGLLEIAVFAWLGAPLALAFFVAKTGRLDWGVTMSLHMTALMLAGFCIVTGGLKSIALVWLCMLPIESALFGGTRTVLSGLCAAMAGFAAVAFATFVPNLEFMTPAFLSNGPAYHLSVLGALLYAALLAYRIESRRQVSGSRIEAEKNSFRLLAENSSDLITRHGQDGKTLFASPAAKDLFGTDCVRFLGSGFFERVHLHDRVKFLQTFSDSVADDGERQCQFRVRRRGGGGTDYLWVEMRCRPVTSDDGTIDLVAVTRDISRAKTHEAELETAREQAEKSNDAKRQFLANISHELRTPLNAIIGFSDILRHEQFGKMQNEKQSEYVSLIHDSGSHLLQVVNDLLDMSKIEAGKYELAIEPFALADVTAKIRAMLSPLAEGKSLAIEEDIDPDLPEISGDRRAFQQIMINLLSNAVKFTPENGKITLGAFRHGRSIKIRIRDNGIGIAADDLERLGTPFVQASNGLSREHEGTGLGLSVVRGLIDLHGGSITIESIAGSGTTVTVTLPLDGPRPVPADETRTLVDLNAQKRAAKPAAADEGQHTTKTSRSKSHARISA